MEAKEMIKGLELKKGDFFTIVRWRFVKDNSYRGSCLEAKVIDPPYARVLVHDGILSGATITLNLDEIEIMPLSPDFVQNVMDEKANKKAPT